jgi:uncharacterized membrane protein
MAKKKFDTNPLDPEFPDNVLGREVETKTLPKNSFETAEFPTTSVTEEQTRRFDNADFNAYQSPYNGQNMPVNYQTTHLYADMNQSSTRKVAGIGLPENILVALPYLPWGVGLIAGLIELLITPKSESKVRFHAAQGFAVHIGVILITTILGVVDNFSDWVRTGTWIFGLAMFVCFIVWTVKAYKGKPIHIEAVDDLTEWLEDKIKLSK